MTDIRVVGGGGGGDARFLTSTVSLLYPLELSSGIFKSKASN